MKILYLLLFSISLYSSDYYAKAQPIESYQIRSNVSGEIKRVDIKKEGRVSDGDIIIEIDDSLDRITLKNDREKLKILNNSMEILQDSLKNAKRVMLIAKDSYDRVKDLKSYTKVQKEAKLSAYLNAKNSFIQTKNRLLTNKSQIIDLKNKIASLEDRVKKKSISVKKGDYIYKIYPRSGDFVNVGAKLIDCYDISYAKLVIFVALDDVDGIKDKSIYLDGKKSNYKIDKLWSVADSKHISSYRAEILIDRPKRFSKLIKVEFR